MTSDDRAAQRVRAGQWLREQRERHGFHSAAELGRAIGATKEVVWSYESGRSSVQDDRAEQIAEAFGMDIIDVRRGLGLWVPPAPAAGEGPVELAPGVHELPLPPELAKLVDGDKVTEYHVLDLSRPGRNAQMVVLITGELPADLEEYRDTMLGMGRIMSRAAAVSTEPSFDSESDNRRDGTRG